MNNLYFNDCINNKKWDIARSSVSYPEFVPQYILNNNFTHFNEMIIFFCTSYGINHANDLVMVFEKTNIPNKYIYSAKLSIQLFDILNMKLEYDRFMLSNITQNNHSQRNRYEKNGKFFISPFKIKQIINCGNSMILFDILNIYGDTVYKKYSGKIISDKFKQELQDIGFDVINNISEYNGRYTNKFINEYIETIKDNKSMLHTLYTKSIKSRNIKLFAKLIEFVPVTKYDVKSVIGAIKRRKKKKKLNKHTRRSTHYTMRIKNRPYLSINSVFELICALDKHCIKYDADDIIDVVPKLIYTTLNSETCIKICEIILALNVSRKVELKNHETGKLLRNLMKYNKLDMIKRLVDNKIVMIQFLHKAKYIMDYAINNNLTDIVNYFNSLRIRCNTCIVDSILRIGSARDKVGRLKLIESIEFPINESIIKYACYYDCFDVFNYIVNKYNCIPKTCVQCLSLINNMTNYNKYKKYIKSANSKIFPVKLLEYNLKKRYSYSKINLKFIIRLSKINNTPTDMILDCLINANNFFLILKLIDIVESYDKIKVLNCLVKNNYLWVCSESVMCIWDKLIDCEWDDGVRKYFSDNIIKITNLCIVMYGEVNIELLINNKKIDWSGYFSYSNARKEYVLSRIKNIHNKTGISIDIANLIENISKINTYHPFLYTSGAPEGKTISYSLINDKYYKIIDTMINDIDNIDIQTECFNNMIQNDDFFALYKVRTDDKCLKYKQVALNIVVDLLMDVEGWTILNLIKFCYGEINILYKMGARPSPYTIGIICSISGHCVDYVPKTVIKLCKKILIKYNNIFQFSVNTPIMKILRNNDVGNISVNIVEYNPDNGMFDDGEINMYLYMRAFDHQRLQHDNIKKADDELDMLVDEIENCG